MSIDDLTSRRNMFMGVGSLVEFFQRETVIVAGHFQAARLFRQVITTPIMAATLP